MTAPLLNYQTSVPPSRTIGEIQTLLAKARASAIMTEYADGEPSGLSFRIETPYGVQAFTLPVHVEKVAAVLARDAKNGSGLTERQRKSARAALKKPEWVAWRILKDWIEAQVAIVRTEMVTLDQVMLPYMQTGDGSVYELVVAQQAALGSGE